MRTNNQQGELLRQLSFAMSCGERKSPLEAFVMIMGVVSAEKEKRL